MDDFVKVNWSVAVDKTKKKMGIGVIIRNSKGEVLATLGEPKDHIIAPDVVEAMTA
jgi:N6-adenosine-specific RNA methylase IME4